MATVVLAYSGGLDTSVAIRWIKEKYDLDVIALTIDVGNERDLPAIAERARTIGAVKALVVDGREDFVRYFVWPALQAGAIYEGQYPLATALARPLIARLLVEVARAEGAVAVAHGCTGKGNDQVRFDVSINTLAPDLKIIAPVREWSMTRDNEIAYAAEHKFRFQRPMPAHTRLTRTSGAVVSNVASWKTHGQSHQRMSTHGRSTPIASHNLNPPMLRSPFNMVFLPRSMEKKSKAIHSLSR